MAFWVYILRCADGRYYTGHTDNLGLRFAQHQAGGYCDFTSRRRPVIEALESERRIKPWSKAKKEALIRGDWSALSYFVKPPKDRPSTQFILSDAAGCGEGLGTNGGVETDTNGPFVSSEVETRLARPSTTLGTNGVAGKHTTVRVERSRDTSGTSLDYARDEREGKN